MIKKGEMSDIPVKKHKTINQGTQLSKEKRNMESNKKSK
jgi:hypothetical protein